MNSESTPSVALPTGQRGRFAAACRVLDQAIAAHAFPGQCNLHDGRSWLNHFPWERVNYPLLFDRNAQPKPAFGAVLERR